MDSSIFFDIFAFALRFYMSRTFLSEYFQARPEISTPANSMLRVKEGVALYKEGISPYLGDTYHGTPLLLLFVRYVSDNCPILIEIIFPLCDLITAFSLQIATSAYLRHLKQKENTKINQKRDVKVLLITEEDLRRLPMISKLSYLFNPLSIVSCIAHVTTTMSNAVIAAGVAFMLTNHPIAAVICIAVASYNDFYPFLLIAPLIVWFAMNPKGCLERGRVLKSAFLITIGWSSMVAILLYVSSLICNGWTFLDGTYSFILVADDLTPNPGLFWYFFTEMFDQFRLFFTWVFQLNPIVYVVPLTICLRDDAVILLHQLLTIITIFKSYPSVGDAALILSFLPALSHLNRYIRHRFIISLSFVACAALAPIMWYLWIHAGSANANFYFAITLVYSTAHIFLLTDLLYAHLRRQLHFKHGMKPMFDGKEALVMLK